MRIGIDKGNRSKNMQITFFFLRKTGCFYENT